MEDQSLFAAALLPVALAFIMTSLGLALTLDDFRRVFIAPRGVAIGLANLLVISPLLAFGVAEVYGLAAVFATGLVLLGASPGGTTANMLTHLARGNTALSISMTAISSVAAVITVPLFLGLATSHFGADELDSDPEMLSIVARVFSITIVPLSIGMYIRSRAPDWTERNESRAKTAAMVIFLVVVAGAIADEWKTVTDNLGELAVATITLNVLAMSISFTISRLARLDNPSATAIALELGVHNATLAIAVGAAIDSELTIPAAVYSAFMFITAGLFARLMHRRNAGTDAPAPAVAQAEPAEA